MDPGSKYGYLFHMQMQTLDNCHPHHLPFHNCGNQNPNQSNDTRTACIPLCYKKISDGHHSGKQKLFYLQPWLDTMPCFHNSPNACFCKSFMAPARKVYKFWSIVHSPWSVQGQSNLPQHEHNLILYTHIHLHSHSLIHFLSACDFSHAIPW